jgi:Ca-activated chloride channel homolog
MTFAAPTYLLALLAIPLVAVVHLLARGRRRRHALRFPAAAVLAGVSGRGSRARRLLAPALLAAAAATLAVAAARPQATFAVPVEKASVMLITDESGSMSATDVDPSRLAAAASAAEDFLDRSPKSLLVGFIGYSTQTNQVIEPTQDHDQVRAALQGLQANGGTATGDALNAALDRLQAQRGKDGKRAPAAIVLLSDGKTNQGSDPLAAAR